MPDIPLPTSSSPGFRPHESGGRLMNLYAEQLTGNPRWNWVRRMVPGLLRMLEVEGRVHCRGLLDVGTGLYAVYNDRAFYIVRSGGSFVVTDIGSLPGDDLVTIARNNKAPTPDVLAVSAGGVYTLTPTSIAPFVDADLPQPVGVESGFNYFFFPIANGECYASGINDITVGALDFTTADARPDGLKRAVFIGDRILLMGSSSIQPYQNTGNPEAFPLSPGPVITRGLAGKFAVAGHEPGWAGQVIFVADDNTVCQIAGNSAVPISTPYIARLISDVPDKETLEASVYVHGSNAKWVLSSPTWTWEYNLNNKQWNERKSGIVGRFRGSRMVNAFGRWLTGDYSTGLLGEISDTAFSEYGELIRWQLETGPQHSFPSRVAFPRVDFDISTGQGIAAGQNPIQTDPMVDISWSDDGNYTYGETLRRSFGKQGEYGIPVSVNRTGRAGNKGRSWRLEGSDPVYTAIFGASCEATQRAS